MAATKAKTKSVRKAKPAPRKAGAAVLVPRDAEVDLVTSVQAAVAAGQDLRKIYDLVGRKLHAIFRAQVVGIARYDPKSDVVGQGYLIEKGKRLYPPDFVVGN